MKKSIKKYKRNQVSILNQLFGYRNGNPKRFTVEVFDDCSTEIQVDNRKRTLLMQG